MREFRVAVILSGSEQFSPYFGGAVARWTYEVYRRVPGWIKATIFGYPTAEANRYKLPFVASRNLWLPSMASRIPYVRRYEDAIWLAH